MISLADVGSVLATFVPNEAHDLADKLEEETRLASGTQREAADKIVEMIRKYCNDTR